MVKKTIPELKSKAGVVDVWSFSDEKLQSLQLQELKETDTRSYVGVIQIANHRIIRLQYDNEQEWQTSLFEDGANDFSIVEYRKGDLDPSETNWESPIKGYGILGI